VLEHRKGRNVTACIIKPPTNFIIACCPQYVKEDNMARMKNTARADGRVQSRVYLGGGKYKYVYAANNKELQEKVTEHSATGLNAG